MLRSSTDLPLSATRGGAAIEYSSCCSGRSRAAVLPRRPASMVINSIAAVGDPRSISSPPRLVSTSACASALRSNQRVEAIAQGLASLDRRRKIARNRRAKIVTASAAAKKGGDEDEDGEGGEGEPSTSSSSDAQKQPDLATLRAKLDAAIEAEDYALAASLRDALRALEDDAVAGVAEANARFYAAFRAADIDVMASCLGFGDNVTVIHPGCNAIRGREAVLESWRVIFSGATRAAGKGAVVALDIEAVEVQVYAPPTAAAPKGSDSSADYSASPSKSDNNSKGTGALGVVTCVERVDGGDATGRVVATNVFERGGDGRYRMILHHGSSAPPLRRKG